MDIQNKFQDLLKDLQNSIRDRRWGDYMNNERQESLFKELSSKFQMLKHSQENCSKKIDLFLKKNKEEKEFNEGTVRTLYSNVALMEKNISSLEKSFSTLTSKMEDLDIQISVFLQKYRDVKEEQNLQKTKKRLLCDDSDDLSDTDNSFASSISNSFSYTNDKSVLSQNKKRKKGQSLITPDKKKIDCCNSSTESIEFLGVKKEPTFVQFSGKKVASIKIKKEKSDSSFTKSIVNPYKKKNFVKKNWLMKFYFLFICI